MREALAPWCSQTAAGDNGVMTLDGTYTFNASRPRVWQILMDPATISSCIPGCTLEAVGADRYRATLSTAALTGGTGTVEMIDKVEPESYRLVIRGEARHGSASADSRITLREESGTTIVSLTGTMAVSGMMALAGERMIGGASKMMLDRFFGCLAAKA